MSNSITSQIIKYLLLLKGKGRAGKKVQTQRKGNESANKRVRIDNEVEVEDVDSESGGEKEENVGEKAEKAEVSLFSYLNLRC